MAKKYRVKHYYGKNVTSYRAKPRLITIILVVLVFVGLGYLGTVIHEPVYNFIMSVGQNPTKTKPEPLPEPSVPEPEVSEAQKEPEPPPAPEFEKLRAVYAPHAVVSDPAKLDELIDSIKGTQVNSVMVDIKNAAGEVLFKSKNDMASKWGVISQNAVDLSALSRKLDNSGLSLAVKLSMFQDPKAASAGRLQYAINYQNSDFLWLDNSPENGGKPWLNPYSVPTQEYLDSLALEAVDAGAKLVVLENLRFPDNSGVYATFGKDAVAMSRSGILSAVLSSLSEHAEEKGARVAMYIPVTDAANQDGQDNRYGGNILKIPEKYVLLGAQPSQFYTGYSLNGLEVADPLENPAGAVGTSINYARQGLSGDAVIIPMLQGGNDAEFNGAKQYSAADISAQIAEAEKLGCDEYVLYNTDAAYLLD